MNHLVRFIAVSVFLITTAQASASDLPAFSNGNPVISNQGLITCNGHRSRTSAMGTVRDENGQTWDVPAKVNFDPSYFADDLHNVCSGITHSRIDDLDLNKVRIRKQAGGQETYTAYLFGDNYFEFYVNGQLLAIDPVPFTPFNSSVIRFTAPKPFTIAVKLVDWEENLGIGTEKNRRAAHHPGDGGFVAVIKNEQGDTVAITDETWRAQTFYVSPITDRTCLIVQGGLRDSRKCASPSHQSKDGLSAAHWPIPDNWADKNFNDNAWPSATTFTNDTVGVDNKSSYTNFRDLFDTPIHDAQFIWSPNLVLDNLVLARKTVR